MIVAGKKTLLRAGTSQERSQQKPYLYINLRFLLLPAVYLLLFLPPYLKGLFFAPDLLPAHMVTAVLFALLWYDRINRRQLRFLQEPMDLAVLAVPLAYLLSLSVAADRRAALGEFLKYLNYFMVYWLVYGLASPPAKKTGTNPASSPGRTPARSDTPQETIETGLLSQLRLAGNQKTSLGGPVEGLSDEGKPARETTVHLVRRGQANAFAAQLPFLRRFLQVIFLSALGVAAIGLGAAAGYVRFPAAYEAGRIMSTLQYPNTLAAFLMVASLLGLALWAEASGLFWPSLYAAGLYLFILSILGTLSRGGWVIFPLALLALLVGLPPHSFWRSVYNLLATAGIAIVVGRAFLPRVTAGQGAGAAKWVLLGLVLAIASEYLYRLLHWVVNRYLRNPLYRNVFVGGLILYALLLASLYALYLGSATPSLADEFLPARVVDRAETIGTQDTSLQGRLIYTLDAFRIVRRYPLLGVGGGGWNALYHQYQSALYWTTEVHNHFAQILVETGLVGLIAYLLLWGGFLRRLYLLWQQWGPAGLSRGTSGEGFAAYWSLLWGAGVATIALGVHSAIDFDLSLPALSFILWGLFGLVRGQPLPARYLTLLSRRGEAAAREPESFVYPSPEGSHPSFAPSHRALPLAVAFVLSSLTSATLFYPAYRLNQAGLAGAEGAKALEARMAAKAEGYLLQAHQLDPFSSSYLADLSQLYTAVGRQTGEKQYLEKGSSLAQQAAGLQPHNLPVQQFLVNLYLLQGRTEEMVAQAELVTRLVPLDPRVYEGLARAYLLAAQAAISQHHQEISGEYLKKVLALPQQMNDRFTYLRRQRFFREVYRPPANSGALQLAQGQASLLLGDAPRALPYLEVAARTGELRPQAQLWQALALERLGDRKRASLLLEQALKARPELREEYQRVKGLLP